VNDELERIRQEEVVAQLQSTVPASGKLMAWKIMRRAEDEGSMFISNSLIYVQIHTALQPRKPTSTQRLMIQVK
jgi:2-succinyl-5-enolpyruvyl-6-hydroxy-3-cyclohexene-1-carboxylate synthase